MRDDNQYEFDKLSAEFDRELDKLKRDYDQKARDIFWAENTGKSIVSGSALWKWFDRKTKYRLKPKIMIALLTFTVFSLLGMLFLINVFNVNFIFSVDAVLICLSLALAVLGEFALTCMSLRNGRSCKDHVLLTNPILNPGFRHMKGNIWHHDDDD